VAELFLLLGFLNPSIRSLSTSAVPWAAHKILS